MNTYIIIPAREGGERLPDKALLDETGNFLFIHTYENCKKVTGIKEVYVTSDSQRIENICSVREIPFIKTGPHDNGTARVIEATKDFEPDSFIINCQVDYPLIDPQIFYNIINQYNNECKPNLAVFTPVYWEKQLYFESDKVKVVFNPWYEDIYYFSRAQIPFKSTEQHIHVGIYGYNYNTLQRIHSIQIRDFNSICKTENLEQLDWLGFIKFRMVNCNGKSCLSINSRKDYDKFLELIKNGNA